MKRFSLRTKLVFMITVALILAILISAFMIRDFFYENLLDQKMTTTDILTASLVHDIKFDYEVRENISTREIIRKYITYYRIIKNISFYDTNFTNIADSNPQHVGQTTQNPNIIAAISSAKPGIEVIRFDKENLGIRSIAPILKGSKIFGAVVMDVSIEDIETSLSAINRHIATILIITVFIAALIIFVMLRSSILIRLDQLIRVTREISAGNYTIRLDDTHKDEIGQLSQAFDRMAADLRKSKQELEDYHAKNLEQKVQELRKAYKELKNAQSQLVLNEKMASLGILVAGIAHEINTPLGAISNVSRNVESKINTLPQRLKTFKENAVIPAELTYACLTDIIQTALGINQFLSYKDTRAVENFLKNNDVGNWREVAGILINLNFIELKKIEKYLPCFQNEDLFHLIASIGTVAQAAKISETSSNKIQEIVLALKYYAYTDQSKTEMIRIDESIHTALVLLRNKFKYKIKVSTKFDENIPPIPCTSEIHQVWTNLLSNSYDAIEQIKTDHQVKTDHQGEIFIRVRKTTKQVVITITDNGIGIPEDKLENIFDPFFTTKDIGKGTGLGLSIVSGIIKKHNGNIRVNNLQSPTIFEITLPLDTICVHNDDQPIYNPLIGHQEDDARQQGCVPVTQVN